MKPRGSRRVAALATAALAVAPALIFGSAATAATNGNWWYSAYHVADATAAGWTGKGVKVAVIDGSIHATAPVFSGTNLTVDPTPLCSNSGASATTTDPNNYHASNVTAMLIGNGAGPGAIKGISPDASVMFYGWGTEDVAGCITSAADGAYGVALRAAVNSGAKIVTTSVTSDPSAAVAKDIAWALSKGVVLVASTPNTTSTPGYPYDYNGVVAVNAMNPDGTLQGQNGKPGTAPDVHADTTVVAAGVDLADSIAANTVDSGASYATPLVAGMLADVWQKYPKATANQLIQSLIHNATPPAGSEGYGYGAASLTKMLAVDPTSYPNTNPLMNKASGVPTAQQVAAAAGNASTSKATDASSPAPQVAGSASDSTQAVITGAVVVAVLGLIIAAGIALLVVFLVRRSRRSQVSRG